MRGLRTPKRARQVDGGPERGNTAVDAALQSRRDLLQQPTVAIRIVEGRERSVGAVFRIWTGNRTVRAEMEDVTDLDAGSDERVPSGLDVRDDKVGSLGRAGRGGSEVFAELN